MKYLHIADDYLKLHNLTLQSDLGITDPKGLKVASLREVSPEQITLRLESPVKYITLSLELASLSDILSNSEES